MRHSRKRLKTTEADGKTSHVHRLQELTLLRSQSSQGNLQIQCNPSQNLNCLFCINGQANPEFIGEHKGPRRARTILKESKIGGLNFTMYYRTIIKTVCYWPKEKHMDHWKRTEIPEIIHTSI
jgi:hypothetical protein